MGNAQSQPPPARTASTSTASSVSTSIRASTSRRPSDRSNPAHLLDRRRSTAVRGSASVAAAAGPGASASNRDTRNLDSPRRTANEPDKDRDSLNDDDYDDRDPPRAPSVPVVRPPARARDRQHSSSLHAASAPSSQGLLAARAARRDRSPTSRAPASPHPKPRSRMGNAASQQQQPQQQSSHHQHHHHGDRARHHHRDRERDRERSTSAERDGHGSRRRHGGDDKTPGTPSHTNASHDAASRNITQTHSDPVRVPGAKAARERAAHHFQGGTGADVFQPSGPPLGLTASAATASDDVDVDDSSAYVPLSNLNFPPRLPLPIQEEIYTPGSPIITSADLSAAGGLQADEDIDDATLPHATSLLSNNTTVEDDDERDLEASTDEAKGRTVPTLVEWKQPGTRVYITGTFAAWSKKYRMHRNPTTNVLSATLELLPGTHHVKFIVDGEMQLSKELPTAVDYTNILVNYIEVSADDIPIRPQDHTTSQALDPSIAGLHPPLVLPPGVERSDFGAEGSGALQGTAEEQAQQRQQQSLQQQQQQRQAKDQPTKISTKGVTYGTRVPMYLLDLDRDESSRRFQRAASQVHDIPTPPSLPLFLSKSILNGTMPMKDDSSVLNMPNHTVLNHLATSSIKNDVLATSLTTRYKRKYVTTIIYRPTSTDD